jgi:hypothetical protein
MLKSIINPKKTTIEADIKAQLQEAHVSTIAVIDPSFVTNLVKARFVTCY